MSPDDFSTDSSVEPMRSIAERKINEWIQNGGLSDIPGSGRPQELDDEPFVPDEMRLSFKILKNAGVVPDWAELGNAVDAERDAIELWVERSVRTLNEIKHSSGGVGNVAAVAGKRRARRVAVLVAAYRRKLEELNALIDRLNVAAPVAIIQRQPVPIERAVARLRTALREDTR